MFQCQRFPEARNYLNCIFLILLALLTRLHSAGYTCGIDGPLRNIPFRFGFFIAAFLTIYSDIAIIGFVACALFSIGIGLPGGGSILAVWDRLWTCFLGGLFGLAGVAIHGIITRRNLSKYGRAFGSYKRILGAAHISHFTQSL